MVKSAFTQPDSTLGPVPEDNQPGHHPVVEQDKPTRRPRRPPALDRRFDFRFEAVMLLAALPFGVRPSTTGVQVNDREVQVRFGHWSMDLDRADIASVEVTGPYWLPKVVGPAHLSLSDGGITFATNRQRGVCIQLVHPRPAIEPFGVLRHGSLTVTVEDCDGLARLLDPS